MPDLSATRPITSNGFYVVTVFPGAAYLFTLKGTFGGATVTLQSRSNVNTAEYETINEGSWTATTEVNVRPPSDMLRLTVTGATGATSISANLVQYIQ
jgi:hypothetical protein